MPEEVQASEKILGVIAKLLTLAGNNPNEQEASQAMAKAQELLQKYNLDYAQVQDRVGNNVAPEKREKVKVNKSAMYGWQRDLWNTLARLNFCFHWVVEVREPAPGKDEWGDPKTRKVKRHMLLGRESNVHVVLMIGDYLCETMERLLPYPNRERLSRSAISWRRGCAQVLIERLEEQAAQARGQVDEAGTGLALRNIDEREFEANYDARYGAGMYAAKKEREAKWAAEEPECEKARQEAEAKAEADYLAMLQNETPAQKQRRELREEKERVAAANRARRASRSYHNERYREASKVDWHAADAGMKTGREISLNKQVGTSDQKRLG